MDRSDGAAAGSEEICKIVSLFWAWLIIAREIYFSKFILVITFRTGLQVVTSFPSR
jgi:hypothetical protein